MTSTPDLSALTERLTRLEQQGCRLQRGVFGLALAFAATIGCGFAVARGQPVADELRARRFTLVDGSGEERGAWKTDGELELPSLVMLDDHDKERIEMSVLPVEALFVMRDREGMNRVGMAVDAFPHFMMHDKGQKPRLHLSVGQSGAPSFLLIHEDGTFPGGMGLKDDGEPWIKPDGLMELSKATKKQ